MNSSQIRAVPSEFGTGRANANGLIASCSSNRREWIASAVCALFAASVVKGQEQTSVKPVAEATVDIPPQVWQETRTTSRRLFDQSRDSFERGLMPLPDHLEQLSVATQLNLRLAGATNQRDVQRDWQAQLVRQLEGVTGQLERFRQPASAGWESDVLLARFSLAEARAQLAKFDDKPELAAAVQSQAVELARQHWAKRLDDSSVGHTSAMQIWRATSLLNNAEGRSAATSRNVLQQAIEATDRWSFLGAGIGRNDLREAFQYEVARVDLQESKPGTQVFTANAQQAESLLVRLHETTTQYQSKGTASLYDVATTFRERTELHSFLQSAGGDVVPKSWQQRRAADFRNLQRLATDSTDRRGRNAADTTYVDVLALAEKTADVR